MEHPSLKPLLLDLLSFPQTAQDTFVAELSETERTAIGTSAHFWLVDEVYPHAEYIRLVQDSLNTHTPASLYETFAPAEARRLLQRIEFHYTPKHGSWLNMAEIEIAILERLYPVKEPVSS